MLRRLDEAAGKAPQVLGGSMKPSLAIGLGAGLVLILMSAWALRLDHLRAGWQEKFTNLSYEAGLVLDSVRLASDNPKLEWQGAAKQVEELGSSRNVWKVQAQTLSGTVDAMGAETVRLKAENAELAAKVRVLNARRNQLVSQLERDAMDPGDIADCWAQIREVEESLNRLRKEGF